MQWEGFIHGSRTNFNVPKKGDKPTAAEKDMILKWCHEQWLDDQYRRSLGDPYGNSGFVAAVGLAVCNTRSMGFHATEAPWVTMTQLALVSLKVTLFNRQLPAHIPRM